MDCRETQERWLDSFEEAISPLEQSQLELHIAECPECARFAGLQGDLDLRLGAGIAAPRLSPAFRRSLQARIAAQRRDAWPDWLPAVAHGAGSAVAIALCALLLPLPVQIVAGAGVVFAFLAYALQTLIVSALERTLGTRYTIDTLKTLRRRFPEIEFVWLMGSDNLAQFHRWRRWTDIAALMPIAVIVRPGSVLAQLNAKAMQRFARRKNFRKLPAIIPVDGRRNEASATAIRAMEARK